MSARRRQTTDTILVVRPARFGANPETAASNAFQRTDDPRHADEIHTAALAELDGLVLALGRAGVRVDVHQDVSGSPDAIFPNNWLSTHGDGSLVLYPLATASRRAERSSALVARLEAAHGYRSIVDLRQHEDRGEFLEGTGSLVLDRAHRVAYACLSGRTSEELAFARARAMGFQCVTFRAETSVAGRASVPVYHTNVVMAVGERDAVVCYEAILDSSDRERVRGALERTGHRVVRIDLDQLESFCGNVLQLSTTRGGEVWAMSTEAFFAFTPEQREILGRDALLVHTPVPTIERVGGGSVRCVLAEIFGTNEG